MRTFTCTWPGGDTRRVSVAGFSMGWCRVRWIEPMDGLSRLLGEKPAASLQREVWVPEQWLA